MLTAVRDSECPLGPQNWCLACVLPSAPAPALAPAVLAPLPAARPHQELFSDGSGPAFGPFQQLPMSVFVEAVGKQANSPPRPPLAPTVVYVPPAMGALNWVRLLHPSHLSSCVCVVRQCGWSDWRHVGAWALDWSLCRAATFPRVQILSTHLPHAACEALYATTAACPAPVVPHPRRMQLPRKGACVARVGGECSGVGTSPRRSRG
jgi:hypothetical protein